MRLAVIIIILVLLIGGLAGYYFLGPSTANQKIVYSNISESDYRAIFDDLQNKIDNLSPTPPTEDDWTVAEMEFAKNSNLAYVIYHDTHNIFRMLLEISKIEEKYDYRVRATFESAPDGWQKKFGEDLAQGKELIKVE